MKELSEVSVLVTGGAGFIGSNIVEYLLKNNVKFVRVVDNLVTGHKSNIEKLLNTYSNMEFVYGDISNLETCRQVVQGIDIICNQAALGSVPRSIINPLSSHNTNVNGFLNILIAAKENNIKRVVYASSSSVYGDSEELPKVESRTGNLLSPYAITKKVNELYGEIFTKLYGLECIGLRYFNVFGPKQDPNGAYAAVIPKFISMMVNNIVPTINGDGSYSRDFTYIDNVIQANVLAMLTENEKAFGTSFNIGAERQTTLNDLFDVINTYLNLNMIPKYGEKRVGDIAHSHANINKARDILNYNPQVSFSEGIIKTINYYNKLN